MERDEVLARLHEAFPAVPLDFTRALTGGTDDGEYRRHVDGRTWTDVGREYALRRSDVLSFLEPRHFVAVLPIYLQSLVQDGWSTSSPDTMLVVLDRDQEPRFDHIIRELTDAQRAAVFEVLQYFAAHSSGGQAAAARHTMESWRP